MFNNNFWRVIRFLVLVLCTFTSIYGHKENAIAAFNHLYAPHNEKSVCFGFNASAMSKNFVCMKEFLFYIQRNTANIFCALCILFVIRCAQRQRLLLDEHKVIVNLLMSAFFTYDNIAFQLVVNALWVSSFVRAINLINWFASKIYRNPLICKHFWKCTFIMAWIGTQIRMIHLFHYVAQNVFKADSPFSWCLAFFRHECQKIKNHFLFLFTNPVGMRFLSFLFVYAFS